MAEKTAKPSMLGKALKLFLLILLVLLVPLVMREFDPDPETLKITGRFAGGSGLAMLLYGIVTKIMKAFAFVVLALLVGVGLVSEGVIEAPKVFSEAKK